MAEAPMRTLNEALKTSFWIVDVMVEALPNLLAQGLALEAVAKGQVELTDADAKKVIEAVEAFAFSVGILQGALADVRMQIPGDDE